MINPKKYITFEQSIQLEMMGIIQMASHYWVQYEGMDPFLMTRPAKEKHVRTLTDQRQWVIAYAAFDGQELSAMLPGKVRGNLVYCYATEHGGPNFERGYKSSVLSTSQAFDTEVQAKCETLMYCIHAEKTPSIEVNRRLMKCQYVKKPFDSPIINS